MRQYPLQAIWPKALNAAARYHAAPHSLRILGIDPGLRVTGFGVLEKTGSQLRYCSSGAIKHAGWGRIGGAPESHFRLLAELIQEHQPQPSGCGKGLRQRQSAIHAAPRPGAGRGDLRPGGGELPVAEYTALQVKQAVVGQRQGRQGTGAGNGQAPVGSAGRAPAGCRRRPGLCHLPCPWRRLGHCPPGVPGSGRKTGVSALSFRPLEPGAERLIG